MAFFGAAEWAEAYPPRCNGAVVGACTRAAVLGGGVCVVWPAALGTVVGLGAGGGGATGGTGGAGLGVSGCCTLGGIGIPVIISGVLTAGLTGGISAGGATGFEIGGAVFSADGATTGRATGVSAAVRD